ncbi:MAG: electron transfer flavoprotein subunit beta/FixA family protein [Lentisphaerae bacterium]|nr:electron transfer flavoprotein subunit beta/FixA family protein [Lentisphaerota bacterium]OQC11970.1 MAG: Acryloyl-CoA reductase electron transfer subunit gamma [Lentisphaerae bacterium ADurb.Bin082]HQL86468.1 electron transfer flavoprotein subunit beta/FixA family protein [Lentisphaeria bacterium]
MRLAVLVKQVPDTRSVQMDETTGTVVRKSSDAILNPLDAYALRAALLVKDAAPGSTVTALSMGPASAEKALREVLALGADDAVLICDRACAGSDTWATAVVLAAALQKHGPFDLVITGERATDGDTGQVGPEVAAHLNLSLATFVDEVSVNADGLEVERKVETGLERWRLRLPALISVTKAIGEIGLPTLAGKMAARRREIPITTAADLGLDPATIGLKGSPTRVVKIFYPTLARKGRQYRVVDEASLADSVEVMAKYMAEVSAV